MVSDPICGPHLHGEMAGQGGFDQGVEDAHVTMVLYGGLRVDMKDEVGGLPPITCVAGERCERFCESACARVK